MSVRGKPLILAALRVSGFPLPPVAKLVGGCVESCYAERLLLSQQSFRNRMLLACKVNNSYLSMCRRHPPYSPLL
jgi:hypothetical protein